MDLILTGACGRMGCAVAQAAPLFGARVVAGVDSLRKPCGFPVYETPEEITECADVIVDFSSHTLTPSLVRFASERGLPAVICTTGHDEAELKQIGELSGLVPVFRSGNMSLGINVMLRVCREIAGLLGGKADIEIVEKHHNRKLDAPSGTAIMIAEAIREALPGETELVFDRTDRREERPGNEIGISSIRGGNIVGEHEVLFCFGNEVLTLKHTALGRSVFAEGAIRAASFLLGRAPGLYSMKDLLEDAETASADA